MRNGAAWTWAERKLPFPLTCSQGWESEWKAIWECLPTEVMNTVQIRGRGLSICSALAFPTLTTLNCFLSFALQPIPAALIFSQSFFLFLFHFLYLLRLHSPHTALQQVSGAVRVDRLSSGRSRGQGQHLQIVWQKAETAWPSVKTQCATGIARPCRVTENRDLELWAEKNSNPLSLVVGLQASVPRLCVHSLAYGVLLKMD